MLDDMCEAGTIVDWPFVDDEKGTNVDTLLGTFPTVKIFFLVWGGLWFPTQAFPPPPTSGGLRGQPETQKGHF